MEKRLMFTKKFSSIPKLQEDHEYRYYILWDEKSGQYGIQISEARKEKLYDGEKFYFSFERELVEAVLLYLYENSISSPLVGDMLRDLKVSSCI